MKCGEIWFVTFIEGAGHEYHNDRPALIIQSNEQLRVTTVVTLVPLTANGKKHNDDIIIKCDSVNNLRFDSLIKVHQIQSFDKSRLQYKLGEVKENIMTQVRKYLQKHFSL